MQQVVTVTRHSEPDWLVRQALEGLINQEGASFTVRFYDQSASGEGAVEGLVPAPGIQLERVLIPPGPLSLARNRAIDEHPDARVLFIDADAVPAPSWAREMFAAFDGEQVAVVGGRIVPRWHGSPPLLARSSLVREQYSLLDLGGAQREVEKVVGASFGVDVGLLAGRIRFDPALGRSPGTLLGGEETTLCREARALGLSVRYVGAAVVEHQILPERLHSRWLLRRFYYGGISRALARGAPRPSHRLGSADAACLPVVLPPYLLGYAVGLARRRRQR